MANLLPNEKQAEEKLAELEKQLAEKNKIFLISQSLSKTILTQT
jgi:hypothetical protein